MILLLMCVALVSSVPCVKRDSYLEGSARRNEGFRYYFKTTTSTPVGSTNSPNKPVSIKTITPRGKICAPYEFNETICEYVGDREICGYNKNPEVVESKIKARFLSNGCWLRKGRVECGYKEPFDTIRRPPVNYPRNFRDLDEQSTFRVMLKHKKLVTVTTPMKRTTPVPTSPTTVFQECVEIHGRIVCRTTRGK